jgi:uncharacterized membrane protein
MDPTFALVNGYNVSLWLHISAVMVGFGSTFALSIVMPVALKLDPRHLPYVHQLSIAINRYFASPALLVVLVTGFYQISDGNWDFDFWIIATLVIVIVLGGLIGAFFLPHAKKMKAVAERDIVAAGGGAVTPSDEYNQLAKTEAIFGPIAGLLLIAAVFLMVTKLGA